MCCNCIHLHVLHVCLERIHHLKQQSLTRTAMVLQNALSAFLVATLSGLGVNNGAINTILAQGNLQNVCALHHHLTPPMHVCKIGSRHT